MGARSTFRVAVRKFDPFESAIRKQWRRFEETERTGLALEAVPMDLHPLHESLFEQRGLRDGAWDVAFLPTDWLAEAAAGSDLADLAPRIAQAPPDGYPEAWSESLLRFQRVEERVLGLPYHDGPECLIYRQDLFEEESVRVPETWDEFHRVAQHFQRPDKGLYGTVFAAYPDGHNTVYDFCLQLWSRGGELFDADGQMRLDTPAAREALEFYWNLVGDSSAVHPRCREFDSVKSGLAFAAGEVAMMVNWFGFAAMSETIPESKVKGKVAIGPIPRGARGTHVSLNVYWVLGIAAGSPHQDVAWRFLRHCATAEMDKLLTLEGAIGCRKSTWRDAEVNRQVPFYHRLESLHEWARELPRLAGWAQLAAGIDELVTRGL